MVEYCCVCRKALSPTRKRKLVVNYDNANGHIIAPDDEPSHGQWGFLAIGTGCAKQLPAGFVMTTPDGAATRP